jgi:hypothetical protein
LPGHYNTGCEYSQGLWQSAKDARLGFFDIITEANYKQKYTKGCNLERLMPTPPSNFTDLAEVDAVSKDEKNPPTMGRKPWSLYVEALGLDEDYVMNRIRDRIEYPESAPAVSKPRNPPDER